jgi:predicted NBD/HSP70 family sugar kinase
MGRRSGLSQEELRRRNMSTLLRRVHVDGPISRAALTAELGLNRSTIGDLTGQLEALGLVEEEAPSTTRRSGRPSLVVVPRRDVTVLAVAIDVDQINVALVALGGAVIEQRRRTHMPASHDVRLVVESVAQMAQGLLALPEAVRCLGVGVSVPGAVRASDGVVRFAPNLGWHDEPFTALLADELGMPVDSGNDADLGALAEHIRGAAVGMNDVAFLNCRAGLGGGFLVGGLTMRGADGYAGEVGHVQVDSNGERCHCGAIGCWETKVGEDHLLTLAGRLPGGGAGAVDEVIAAAAAGDRRSAAAVDSVAEWIGVGLRAVVNVFNPSMIVLAGLLAQMWAAREQMVREALGQGMVIAPLDGLRITGSKLGYDVSLLGAAELAFEPLLADPVGLLGAPSATA